MTFDTKWDIYKYRYPHEMDVHWNLKERFLLAHKNRFPESELICLAQTFYNIEVMGCTYKESIMKQIEELSVGLTNQTLRASDEGYVDASSAISNKVKARLRIEDVKKQEEAKSYEKESLKKSTHYISFVKEGATFLEGGTYEEARPKTSSTIRKSVDQVRMNQQSSLGDPIVIPDDDDDDSEEKRRARDLKFKIQLGYKFVGDGTPPIDMPSLEQLLSLSKYSKRGEKRTGDGADLPGPSSKRTKVYSS